MRSPLVVAAIALVAASAAFAIDPTLPDRLFSDDPVVRQAAYREAGALPHADKLNLAPTLALRLEEPAYAERAAMALCLLGEPGVAPLDRQARLPFPGGEYAVVGLLYGGAGGNEALAGLLRNGDADAVVRALGVIAEAGELPSVVRTEVKRLSEDTDERFAVAARAALEAVVEAARDPDKKAREAAFAERINTEIVEAPAVAEASPTVEETPEKWTPDGSRFRTRQPASDAFRRGP